MAVRSLVCIDRVRMRARVAPRRAEVIVLDRTHAMLWRGLIDLVRLLFAEPNPAPIKHWLWRTGLIASPELRLPMTGITPMLAGQLDRLLWARRAAE